LSKIIRSANIIDLKPWQAPSLFSADAINANIDPRTLPGYEDGFEQGYQAGQERARQQMQPSVDHLQQLLETVQVPLATIDEQVEVELVRLTLSIAAQVIRRELRTDPDQIAAVIKAARRALAEVTGRLKIGLHPDDAVLIRSMYGQNNELDGIEIEEDISLTPGGCTLSTQTSFVDARLETRIGKLAAQLLGDDRSRQRNVQTDDGVGPAQ